MITRQEKGLPLTYEEMDSNLNELLNAQMKNVTVNVPTINVLSGEPEYKILSFPFVAGQEYTISFDITSIDDIFGAQKRFTFNSTIIIPSAVTEAVVDTYTIATGIRLDRGYGDDGNPIFQNNAQGGDFKVKRIANNILELYILPTNNSSTRTINTTFNIFNSNTGILEFIDYPSGG